jgi:chitinase
MGTYTIAAAESTYSQLSALYSQYGLTYSWSQLGVTPMIGVNDVTSEIFTLADAQALENFARTKGLGMLSMWSLLRDNPGTLGQVSDSTSGMNYPADSFSQVFDDYGTTNIVNYL